MSETHYNPREAPEHHFGRTQPTPSSLMPHKTRLSPILSTRGIGGGNTGHTVMAALSPEIDRILMNHMPALHLEYQRSIRDYYLQNAVVALDLAQGSKYDSEKNAYITPRGQETHFDSIIFLLYHYEQASQNMKKITNNYREIYTNPIEMYLIRQLVTALDPTSREPIQ